MDTAEGTRYLEDRAVEMIREAQAADGDVEAYKARLLSAISLLALAITKRV